ncbi:low affinity iron permease family protein [Longispora sp. K20-0274]|uniref:low affinity iron permease family protein n=1 Tax=Longispora sp. K20-0274 TaxID=3088255 RepID=UPI00399A30E4
MTTRDQPGGRIRARNRLSVITQAVVDAAGSTISAAVAVALVAAWLVVGLVGGFSHRWLDVLFATSGAITLIMVFFIQHTTGRQLRAVLLKLDELVHTQPGADDALIAAERRPAA